MVASMLMARSELLIAWLAPAIRRVAFRNYETAGSSAPRLMRKPLESLSSEHSSCVGYGARSLGVYGRLLVLILAICHTP